MLSARRHAASGRFSPLLGAESRDLSPREIRDSTRKSCRLARVAPAAFGNTRADVSDASEDLQSRVRRATSGDASLVNGTDGAPAPVDVAEPEFELALCAVYHIQKFGNGSVFDDAPAALKPEVCVISRRI